MQDLCQKHNLQATDWFLEKIQQLSAMLAVNILILFFSFKYLFLIFSGEARGDDDRGANVGEDTGSEHPGGVPDHPGGDEDTRATRVQGKQTQMALAKISVPS